MEVGHHNESERKNVMESKNIIPALYITQATDADHSRLRPLSDEQAERLLLTDPPPVRFVEIAERNGEGVAGYCSYFPDMPQRGGGEVVIDQRIAEGVSMPISETRRRRRIAQIYTHEVAHRLTPRDSHGAVFAAVCAALTMRCFDNESETHAALGWYEVQDAERPGAALGHAIDFGRAHKQSGVPARDLPALAAASWGASHDEAWARLKAAAMGEANDAIERAQELEKLAEDRLARAVIGTDKAVAMALLEAEAERSAITADTLSWSQIATGMALAAFVGLLFGASLVR